MIKIAAKAVCDWWPSGGDECQASVDITLLVSDCEVYDVSGLVDVSNLVLEEMPKGWHIRVGCPTRCPEHNKGS